MAVREAWQIMHGARHETVADNAPEWQEFRIEYACRRWDREKDRHFATLVDRVVAETRIYPMHERPSPRQVLMCVFRMVG